MRRLLGARPRRTFASLVVLIALLPLPLAAPSDAATTLTVAQAVATQDGSVTTVRGYVLALADDAGETSTAKMLSVQVPAAFRST